MLDKQKNREHNKNKIKKKILNGMDKWKKSLEKF